MQANVSTNEVIFLAGNGYSHRIIVFASNNNHRVILTHFLQLFLNSFKTKEVSFLPCDVL